jgi:hypothetical protein
VQISRECTPPYLSTGISNLLQPAQAEVVLGQRSTYLASWLLPVTRLASRKILIEQKIKKRGQDQHSVYSVVCTIHTVCMYSLITYERADLYRRNFFPFLVFYICVHVGAVLTHEDYDSSGHYYFFS